MSADDYFGRDRFATELIKHIKFVPTPFTLGLDAPWGCGKSFFINHVLLPKARTENLPVIIYDAFEHEKDDDVFVSMVTNILEQASALCSANQTKAKSIILKIANTTGRLVKTCVKIGANAATKIIFKESLEGIAEKLDTKPEVAQTVGGEIDKAIENFILSRVEEGDSYKKLKLLFQTQLAELATEISKNSRLVIIIDELDRCTPRHALEVLETLHHLINCTGVVFLVSYYKEQLQHMVEHTYGKGINASLYLKKFINYDLEFPETDPTIRRQALRKLAVDRFSGYAEKINLEDVFLFNVFSQLSAIDSTENISQREALCFASMAILCFNTSKLVQFATESEFALIIYWAVKKPGELKKLIDSRITLEQREVIRQELDYHNLSLKLRLDGSSLDSLFKIEPPGIDNTQRNTINSLIKNLLTMA